MSRMQIGLVAVFTLLAIGWGRAAQAEHLTADQMKAALRTATVEENGFIDNVLILVNKRILPEELLNSTFLWARQKPRYKFQYFKRGLKVRAADRGISIPF